MKDVLRVEILVNLKGFSKTATQHLPAFPASFFPYILCPSSKDVLFFRPYYVSDPLTISYWNASPTYFLFSLPFIDKLLHY